MESGAVGIVEDSAENSDRCDRSFVVRVPASTSNLGAGFDCFGLALQLYLTVRARVVPEASAPCHVLSSGEGEEGTEGLELPRTEDNLIFRAMSFAAEREGWRLPPVRLVVHNELPLGRGLGSSAAANVAGITLSSLVCDHALSVETVLGYALEMEGHADNIAATYYGGWVVTCVKPDGNAIAINRRWPPDLKVIVVSPDAPLVTAETQSALPDTVEREDAVHNLQRVALCRRGNGSWRLRSLVGRDAGSPASTAAPAPGAGSCRSPGDSAPARTFRHSLERVRAQRS